MLSSVAHYGIELPFLPCMALCDLVLLYVASYGLNVAFHGYYDVWPHLNHHGLVCTSMDLYGLFMALYGFFWP